MEEGRKKGKEEEKKKKYSSIINWENSHTYASRSKMMIGNILMTDAIWKVAEKSAFVICLINRKSVNIKSKHAIFQENY